MKITAIELDGYGVWTGLKIEGLSDGLSVFYGPNEAGKTTLVQFVRSVFYGFAGHRQSYLPPLRGGRPGGSLHVAGPQGNYQVCRHQNQDRNQKFSDDGELVALFGEDGAREGEHQLKTLLCGVDEKTFNNVFAVGLRELQELATLGDTEAAAQLYNLSVGLDRVSLVEVARELEMSRRRLLDPDGRPCQIMHLISQRDRLRAELDALGAATGRYASLLSEHRQAEREIRRLEEQSEQFEQELRTLEIAVAVGDRWQQSAELARQAAALTADGNVPPDALRRLDAINARLKRRRRRARQWKRRREQIRDEAADVKINDALRRQAPRIEALGQQEDWIASLQRRSAEMETEIGELESELHAEKSRLGLGDTGAEFRVPELSPRRLAEFRGPAQSLHRERKRVRQADEERAAAVETSECLSHQLEEALASRHESDLGEATARVGTLVAQLRRRQQLDAKFDETARQQADLEARSRKLVERQVLPAWALLGIGAVFVVGMLSLLAGMLMPASITGTLGWPLAILGLSGTLAAVASKFLLEHSNARQLTACREQVAMLRSEGERIDAERRQMDAQLGTVPIFAPAKMGLSPSPPGLENQLAAAEKTLSALEELTPLDARRQSAAEQAEAAGRRVGEARREAAAAAERWRAMLRQEGLPEKLPYKSLRELATGGSRLGQLQRQLEIRYEEFQERTRQLEAISARIAQLASEVGLESDQEQPIERLHALVALCEEQEKRIERRLALGGQAQRLRSQLDQSAVAVSRLKTLKRRLFQAAGVDSEEQLRRVADQAVRAAALRDERDALEREIDAAIAGRSTREAIAEQLDSNHETPIDGRLDNLRKQCQAVAAGLRQQHEIRGRLAEQLKTLAEDDAASAKQIELGTVQQRLREAVRNWQKLAVAGRILDDIRTTYQRERQPEALREASTYLDRLTEGRYTRVWTPLEEEVLLVDDAAGASLPIEVLSQGTREQLFLCLRLALVGSYSRRDAVLPLVLDDVLVNFDAHRAKIAAGVLRDFAAEGHQLLVFTCHEHIFKLFKNLRTDVLTLPDNFQTGTTVSLSAPAPKPRRRRKAEPTEDDDAADEETDDADAEAA